MVRAPQRVGADHPRRCHGHGGPLRRLPHAQAGLPSLGELRRGRRGHARADARGRRPGAAGPRPLRPPRAHRRPRGPRPRPLPPAGQPRPPRDRARVEARVLQARSGANATGAGARARPPREPGPSVPPAGAGASRPQPVARRRRAPAPAADRHHPVRRSRAPRAARRLPRVDQLRRAGGPARGEGALDREPAPRPRRHQRQRPRRRIRHLARRLAPEARRPLRRHVRGVPGRAARHRDPGAPRGRPWRRSITPVRRRHRWTGIRIGRRKAGPGTPARR